MTVRSGWGARHARPTHGQATVELALVLPFLCTFLLALAQVALVARDQVRAVHAAREAVREASVGAGAERIAAAAERVLPGARVGVTAASATGEPVVVDVVYHARTTLPLVGPLFPDVDLHAAATMRSER